MESFDKLEHAAHAGLACAVLVILALPLLKWWRTGQNRLFTAFPSMLKIGKLAQQAIAATSFLAERFDAAGTRVSAAEIADGRSLPRPVVAKVLAQLSLHGITTGTTGPTGGYRLARDPKDISLFDIVEAFERIDVRPMCPFGPDWCGHGEPCPLHDSITAAVDQVALFLKTQNLGPFVKVGLTRTRKLAKKKSRRTQ